MTTRLLRTHCRRPPLAALTRLQRFFQSPFIVASHTLRPPMPDTPPPEQPASTDAKKPYDPVHSAPSEPTSPAPPQPKRARLADVLSPVNDGQIPSMATGDGADASRLPPVAALVEPRNSPATAQLIRQDEMLLATAPLQVARLSDHAKMPTRGSALAAGYDLYCAKSTTIPSHNRALVPTDLAIATPPGTYGRVAPRSGLAVKKGLATGAGVIDGDYRGPVMVLLLNHGDADVVVEQGERCAQLVLERYVGADVVDVTPPGAKDAPEADLERAKGLKETVRGAGGFGSTGTN